MLIVGHTFLILTYTFAQQWIPWPEDHFTLGDDVENSKDWTVFPLLHTFPAYCPENSKWVGSTCARCPETVKLLKSIPTLRTALFSRLGPGTKVRTAFRSHQTSIHYYKASLRGICVKIVSRPSHLPQPL